MSTPTQPQPLIKETLLAAVRGSIGANTWRHLYVNIAGQTIDATDNGDKSCAVFVSGILSMFDLIDHGHATVTSTIRQMRQKGWQEVAITDPQPADVIIWDAVKFADGTSHQHIGFYIADQLAISNDSTQGTPQQHAWDFLGQRPIIKLLRWNFAAINQPSS